MRERKKRRTRHKGGYMGAIYRVYNAETMRSYVGQTCRLVSQRIIQSLQNRELFKDARAHGFKSLRWEILELAENEDLNDLEVYYIDRFDAFRSGYNEKPGGAAIKQSEGFGVSDAGKIETEEFHQRMRREFSRLWEMADKKEVEKRQADKAYKVYVARKKELMWLIFNEICEAFPWFDSTIGHDFKSAHDSDWKVCDFVDSYCESPLPTVFLENERHQQMVREYAMLEEMLRQRQGNK